MRAQGRTGADARRLFRAGKHDGVTHGFAPGYVQGNLAVLPKALAPEFLRFCQLNPKPCPLIGMSPRPGDPSVPELGADLDIRTDIPKYRVWRRGELIAEPTDVREVWREDLVAFVLGCSFSFEEALIEDGIELRHLTCDSNVPMYRTSIACAPSGPFQGPMVVSMRPLQTGGRHPRRADHLALPGRAWRAGAYRPPGEIGISDITKPDYGDAVEVRGRRAAGVLGLRGDAASRHRGGKAGVLHHPCTGLDAHHRP